MNDQRTESEVGVGGNSLAIVYSQGQLCRLGRVVGSRPGDPSQYLTQYTVSGKPFKLTKPQFFLPIEWTPPSNQSQFPGSREVMDMHTLSKLQSMVVNSRTTAQHRA